MNSSFLRNTNYLEVIKFKLNCGPDIYFIAATIQMVIRYYTIRFQHKQSPVANISDPMNERRQLKLVDVSKFQNY